jgi:NRPS condensation-like uncharacterized protein
MTEPFAVPDELTCYYDRAAEPANVHVEVRVPGSLDSVGVRAAVASVLAAESRLRARRAAAGRWQLRYYWEFRPAADHDPVSTAVFGDEASLASLRSAFLSVSPPLDVAPPLTLLLAAGPGGDRLILNAHHAWLDGLSCLRLMNEIAAAYSRQTACASPGSPAAAMSGAIRSTVIGPPMDGSPHQHLGAAQRQPAGAAPAVGRAARSRTGVPRLVPIARIAPQRDGAAGADDGYGVELRSWAGLPATGGLRSAGYSVNDLLVTALILTIGGWNARHSGNSRQVRVTMPVGDRDQAGPGGQWANRSRLTAVTARTDTAASALDVLDAVSRQARHAKAHPGAQVDPVSRALIGTPAPVAVKRTLLRAALRTAGPLLCDTSLISNLGVVEPIFFGQEQATELWFSTSAHMPRGLSVGAVTCLGRLQLTFRYRRALFSDAAGSSFARQFCQVLDDLAGQETPL